MNSKRQNNTYGRYPIHESNITTFYVSSKGEKTKIQPKQIDDLKRTINIFFDNIHKT